MPNIRIIERPFASLTMADLETPDPVAAFQIEMLEAYQRDFFNRWLKILGDETDQGRNL